MQSGNLIIRPLEAHLTHKTELIGKMSPYLKLILGNDFKTTPVAKRQHLNPTWNTELVLRYHGEVSLRIEVWDKELIGKDDLVGFGTFDLSSLLTSGQFIGDVPLYYKDKDAGVVKLSINFFPDGSTFSPYASQPIAKNVGFSQGLTQTPPVLSQSLPGSTVYGTGMGETTFLPTQNLSNMTARETTFLPSQNLTPRETTGTILQNVSTLEPIIHKETQRFYEAPVYIHERPVIHEKTIIIEKPIITEKTIIEKEMSIIKEIPELHEKSYYQKVEPVLIRENPVVVKEELSSAFENIRLEGEPIVTQQTEFRREAPVYMREQTELFQKEIIHQRPIIHEKDLIFVEKPVWVEKPEIREMPVWRQEAPSFVTEPLLRREMRADDLTIPNEALVHSERLVVQEVPMFVKERPEIFEREVIVEKPIIYEQPVIYTERQEIHEKPEFIEKRGFTVEQPLVEKAEPLLVRREQPSVTRSSVTTTQSVNLGVQGQQSVFNPMSDLA